MDKKSDSAYAAHWVDAKGRIVPDSLVTPIDKLRDQTVRAIVDQAKGASAVLARFKANTFGDIAAFVEASLEQYDVKVGGAKGNVTLYSYDAKFKVVRQVQDTLKFDERLKAAKALIDECITDWSADARPEIKVLVNDAFQVDAAGDVNTNRVLGLRRLAIQDPKWQRAMQAIGDAISVVGSRSYVRVYERVGDTDQYQAIPLDIANV